MTDAFDPFDADQVQDAWPLLERLRRQTPLAPVGDGMWYVTRHEDCRDVLRDVTSFSNASGFKAPGVVVEPQDRILGEMDPPQHTAVRRVMVMALTPKVVHAAEGFIRATAVDLLDRLPTAGRADLVTAYTVALPNRVTVHLLGLPAEDADRIAGWAKELMESGFPATNRSERGEGFARAFPEFAGYIDDRIAQRAAELAEGRNEHPTEVLTRLLELDVDGSPLALPQVRALVRNLITGGLTTTSQLLGNLIDQVLGDPTVEARARAGGAGLAGLIEESLRLRPPILLIARGCVRETAVDGHPLPTGCRVIVGTASANRDDRVFTEPDVCRPDRPNADQHLTFGYGPHVCPGATLARTVARIGMDSLLDAFPAGTLRLAGDYRFENVPTFFEVGPRRLPVDIDRRP
jgi:cytochrome P450